MTDFLVTNGSVAGISTVETHNSSTGALIATTSGSLLDISKDGTKSVVISANSPYTLSILSLPSLSVLATTTVSNTGWSLAKFTPDSNYIIAQYTSTYCFDVATMTQQAVVATAYNPFDFFTDSTYLIGYNNNTANLDKVSIPGLSISVSVINTGVGFNPLAVLDSTNAVVGGGQHLTLPGMTLNSNYYGTNNYSNFEYYIWADTTTNLVYGPTFGNHTHLSNTSYYQGFQFGVWPATTTSQASTQIFTFDNGTINTHAQVNFYIDKVNHLVYGADQSNSLIAKFNPVTSGVTTVSVPSIYQIALDPSGLNIYYCSNNSPSYVTVTNSTLTTSGTYLYTASGYLYNIFYVHPTTTTTINSNFFAFM